MSNRKRSYVARVDSTSWGVWVYKDRYDLWLSPRVGVSLFATRSAARSYLRHLDSQDGSWCSVPGHNLH